MSHTLQRGKRLFITSCTRRKNPSEFLLSAWDRYEGGCFPLLKRFQCTGSLPDDLTIFIISARYGLLLPSQLISMYDQHMTYEQALLLRPQVSAQLCSFLTQNLFISTCIIMEEIYMTCMQGLSFPHLTYRSTFSDEALMCLEQWMYPSERDRHH